MQEEIWKDVPNYEGYYQVSNLGNVKSLTRSVINPKGGFKIINGKKLKPSKNNAGYLSVILCKNGLVKRRTIHQLVLESFLNYKPCGFISVINHCNFDKLDNRLENLEIITQRENASKKHLKSSSIYTGVHWHKVKKKWEAEIWIGKNRKYLGRFKNEYDAHLAYETALQNINN